MGTMKCLLSSNIGKGVQQQMDSMYNAVGYRGERGKHLTGRHENAKGGNWTRIDKGVKGGTPLENTRVPAIKGVLTSGGVYESLQHCT